MLLTEPKRGVAVAAMANIEGVNLNALAARIAAIIALE
jgi:hypothetical protein